MWMRTGSCVGGRVTSPSASYCIRVSVEKVWTRTSRTSSPRRVASDSLRGRVHQGERCRGESPGRGFCAGSVLAEDVCEPCGKRGIACPIVGEDSFVPVPQFLPAGRRTDDPGGIE